MATKNLFLHSPSAGDIDEIYKEGAESISRLSLPSFPGVQTRNASNSPSSGSGFESAVSRVLKHEGGFTASDGNTGSPANFGINQKHNPDVDVRNITQDDAKSIYKQRYWDAIGGDNLPPELQGTALDAAVNQGPANARKWLAQSGGDVQKFNALRRQHYEALAARPEYAKYRKTWLNRLADYEAEAQGGNVAGRGLDPASLQSQLDQEEPGRYRVLSEDEARRLSLQQELDAQEPGRFKVLTEDDLANMPELSTVEATDIPEAESPLAQPGFWERLPQVAKSGWENMNRALDVSRAVLSDDFTPQTVDLISGAIEQQIKQAEADKSRQHDSERELKEAIEQFGKTEGAWDTTTGLFSLLGTVFSNPKGVAIGSVEQIANMLPSMGGALGGAATGAGVGAAAGSVVPGIGTGAGAAAGALWGSRAGLAAGTAALEFGHEITEAITSRLEEQGKQPTKENITALLSDPGVQSEIKTQAAKKGLTLAAVDALTMGIAGRVGSKGIEAARAGNRGGAMRYGAGAVGIEAAGEPIGEAASQLVARGEIDKADVAAEAIYGVPASVGGAAIGTGFQALRDQSGGTTTPPPGAAPSGATPQQPGGPATPPAGGPTATPAPAPAPAAQPAPPSGPLTRAMERAAGAAPEVQPSPVEAQPAPTELPRVRITAENGEAMTGVAESLAEDGTARVVGDDGQVYVIGPDDGVTIEPIVDEEPAAAPEVAAPETDVGIPVSEQDQALTEPQPVAPPVSEAPQEAAPVPVERPLTEWSENELRAQLRAVTQQAKLQGMTDELREIRRTISAEIDRRNQERANERGSAADPVPVPDDRLAGGQPIAQDRADQPAGAQDAQAIPGGIPAGRAEADATPSGESVPDAGTSADAQPALIIRTDGTPFKSEAAARQAMRNRRLSGYRTVQVDGGWALEEAPQQEKPLAGEGLTSYRYRGPYGYVMIGARDHQDALNEARRSLTEGDATIDNLQVWDGEQYVDVTGPESRASQVARGEQQDPNQDINPSQFIKVAADSVGTLRVSDVMRVLSEAGDSAPVVADYITSNRPDLADEVTEVMRDELGRKDYAAPSAPIAQADADTAPAKQGSKPEQPKQEKDKPPRAAQRASEPREMTEEGRAKDGGPIMPGDTFRTLSGRVTTPYPKQKSERYASQWLIDNAVEEAESRGDDFNARIFRSTSIQKGGGLTTADRESMLMYLFGEQPPVAPSILRPLSGQTQESPSAAPSRRSNNKIFTDEAAEAARALLRSKLNQVNSGIDPEVLQAGITLAGWHIERGARAFADFARAMIEDMGEGVRPYLKSWYLGAKFDPRTAGMEGLSTAAEVESFNVDSLDSAAESQPVEDGSAEAGADTEVVVTPSGREIEVRYKVVEGNDLIPSNLDDGRVNPDYPQELQPRNRGKAASELQITNIAARMNPRLLGESSSTTDGAPIVSADGVVESGNGRTMAILRAYRRGMDSAQAYRDWLAGQGYDVAGMRSPVLVRERVTPMSQQELIEYTRDSNARTTMQMSPEEQARADADYMPGIIDLYIGGDIGNAANRPFVRAFIDEVVPQSEQGDMVTDGGALSIRGRKRIEAALMHAAYGDERLVADLFVDPSTEIKTIGGAMLDTAAQWLKMRQKADPGLDVTPQLVDAVNIVRRAREEDKSVYDVANQIDVFSGATDPVTMDFLSMFFRGDRFNRQRSREAIGDMLHGYAASAEQIQPGPDMFGMEPPGAQDILRTIHEKRQREENTGQQGDIFAARTPSDDGGTAGGGRAGQGPGAEAQDAAPQESGGQVNAPSTSESVERDSGDGSAAQSVVPDTDGNAAGQDAGSTGGTIQGADQAGSPGLGDQRVPGARAASGRARGDQPVHKPDGEFRPESRPAGDPEPAGSGSDSGQGSTVERERQNAVEADAHAPGADDLAQRLAAQRKAKNTPTKWGNKASIDAALPLLLPEQRDDVLKAENRLANNNGILFTNGTGTGKTATGLGVAKRFINDGKDNIIIVVPSDKIAADWVKFARMLGVNLKQLEDTKDNGKSGPVVTTYANFGQNETLAQRDWDLVITDESHYLSSNESGDATDALNQLRALTGHHNGFAHWVRQRFPKEWGAYRDAMKARSDANGNPDIGPDRYAVLQAAEDRAREKWEPIEARERAKWEDRWAKQDNLPKTVMLSATPFAYAKNTDYAEGYLFHYIEPANLRRDENRGGGYNSGTPRDRFMMQHFGYRMRYNKLTAPEAGVNSELMEQQFNEWLKQQGALSGRRLEVPFDYDRKFVMVDDAVGTKIDEALKFLREAEDGRYREVYDAVMKQFDYQRRMYLLESMKARAAVPIIREHLNAGRKVVVFHDFNKGGGFDPFRDSIREITDDKTRILAREVLSQPMFKIDFSGLNSPIETMRAAFPDALFFNGTVPKKQRRQNADLFNDDDSGRNLIVVQSDAGREGVSLHDTTGKHQRVEINLGMPVKPVAATQIEGRIYRTGQASDAVFRYLTTGTAWEASAFASKIAERASTAENLALGSEARGLKEAFIDAYMNAGEFPAGPQDGKGGKEYDRKLSAALTASPFERSKTFYYAQAKNTRRRDQREGVDYFATPEPVGFKMVEWAGIQPNDKVLEPSAGHGAIARFFPDTADVTMVEPSYELSQRAGLANGNARIVNDKFESLHINNKYDAIVMNPPYGHGGKTAIEHLAKAAKHLRNGGRIVALIPRGGMADTRLNNFLEGEDAENLYRVASVDLPPSTFERAGTSVNTRIVILERQDNPDDAASINDRWIDLSGAGSINELFDRIEDVAMPERTAPATPEPRQELVEHVTAKGKRLTGIIRTDLTQDQAKAIDPYTFRKKNAEGQTGWFIRSKHLGDGEKFSIAPPTQSAAFKRWFGDSKVVDEDGEPLVVYHGTGADFTIFDSSKADEREPGIFFTSDKGVAEDYAGSDGRVIEAFLSIRNPYHMTNDERIMWQTDAESFHEDGIQGFIKELQDDGHDGIFIEGDPNGQTDEEINNQWVPFRPEQIKSATGNVGTFDGSNPDIRYSVADSAQLRQALTAGDLGALMGDLIERGRVVLHDTTASLPVRNMPKGVQAATTSDGTIHMVADALTPETARPVLLHEAFHQGAEKLIGTKAWNDLLKRLGAIHRQAMRSGGRAREFYDAARRSVARAQRAGVSMNEELTAEEFGAYTIEHYDQAPPAFRKWVDDVIGAVKAWVLRRFGIQAGAVTPAQLRALAVAALRNESGPAGGNTSQAPAATVQTDTPAFRRWFGDSAAVNADGEPIVAYHGTQGDFSTFRPGKTFGDMYFFSENAEYANTMASQFGGEGGNVMPVYLKIENPLEIAHEDYTSADLDRAWDNNHGGLIARDEDGIAQVMVVFDPAHIKSATGNAGTFDPANPDIRFSSAPATSSPAFKRWFKDSKVVDEAGKPLVVYHGTDAQFTEFSRAAQGSNTGSDNTGLGFFFIADRQLAENFARETSGGGEIIAAYLSIQKPLDLTSEGIFSNAEQAPTLWEIFTGDRLSQDEALEAINDDINLGEFGEIMEALGTPEAKAIMERDGFDGVFGDFGAGNVEYVAFRPEQIKSVDNAGTFDPSNADIRYSLKPSKHFKDLTDKQKDFLDKIGPERLPQRLSDRWRQLTDNLGLRIRQAGVDRYAALLRNDQALYGEDTLEGSIASSSWVLARMSHAAGGALSAMIDHGRIYLDPKEKVIDVREGTTGLRQMFQQLGTPMEIDRFMAWVAANRARKLMDEGRENLFTQDEIDAGINLSTGRMDDGRNRGMTYAKAWKEFQQFRDDVLRIAEQSGTISTEQRELWSEEFYVPFYRVLDEDNIGGPSMSSGLSRQQAYKRLKGGKQNLNDLLENTLLNFHHLIQSALKNQAARQAVENAEALGIAHPTTETNRSKKASTFVMVDGQKQWYDIEDTLTFKALSALNSTGLNTPLMKAGRAFKRLFTNMTTITPQFMIANTLRDSLSAMATSPTSGVPFKNAVKGAAVYGNDMNRARMLASGASFSFGHVYGQTSDEIKASLRGTLRNARVISDPKLIPGALLGAWRKWNRVTDFAENVNRAGIWERNQGRGKLKAAFESRDLMDFSAHGEALTVRILTDLVPFLNARIQGLDKLYRSGFKPGGKVLFGKGTKADKQAFARFAAVTGALSVLSMMLYLQNMDDEEYRKLEDWQRDTYWFFRIGENGFFIPKPFEVGAIATLAERALEQFMDPTVAGKKFGERLGHMLTDTFALDLPQIIKPAYELSANRNTFTDRPIETIGMQNLSPSLRVTPNTSRLAEGVSRVMETVAGEAALSPVQIDHLIGAYLGQVGAGTVALADVFWRRAMGEELPARRWSEYQPIRRFYRDLGAPSPYTRYGTDFYNALKEADKAYANVQHLLKFQEFEQADKVMEKEADKLDKRRWLNRTQRELSKINAEMRQIQMDKEMSGEEKRYQLDRLRELRNMITEEVGKELEQERVRKSARQ